MALSANTIRSFGWGNVTQYPVLASQTIYEGSAVGLSSGYARALTAGDIFLGFACGKAVEASAVNGGENVQVFKAGIVDVTITSVAVTDVGKFVYASDDGTFTLTQGSNSFIGKVQKYVTTNTASVEFDAYPAGPSANKIYGAWSFLIDLKELIDGDIVTDFAPGHAGTIEKYELIIHDPASTSDKASTLTLEIGATATTGGVLALTSANCAPLGKVNAATAITALNTFAADGVISVIGASTATFVEGNGTLVIHYSVPMPA